MGEPIFNTFKLLIGYLNYIYDISKYGAVCKIQELPILVKLFNCYGMSENHIYQGGCNVGLSSFFSALRLKSWDGEKRENCDKNLYSY